VRDRRHRQGLRARLTHAEHERLRERPEEHLPEHERAWVPEHLPTHRAGVVWDEAFEGGGGLGVGLFHGPKPYHMALAAAAPDVATAGPSTSVSSAMPS
jgi:hypothetical protein